MNTLLQNCKLTEGSFCYTVNVLQRSLRLDMVDQVNSEDGLCTADPSYSFRLLRQAKDFLLDQKECRLLSIVEDFRDQPRINSLVILLEKIREKIDELR